MVLLYATFSTDPVFMRALLAALFLLQTIAATFGNQAFGSGRFDILQWLIQEGTGGPSPLIFRPN